MKNPVIKITGAGRRTVTYEIEVFHEGGSTRKKGGAYFGQAIEIPVNEEEELEDDPLREIEKRNASGFEAPHVTPRESG